MIKPSRTLSPEGQHVERGILAARRLGAARRDSPSARLLISLDGGAGTRALAVVLVASALVAIVSGPLTGPARPPFGHPLSSSFPQDPTGVLAYAAFLGGSEQEIGWALAVDASGNAYAAGRTHSWDFPVTPGAFDTSLGGGMDAYVAKLSPDGSRIVWATFLGGSEDDQASAIHVDGAGNVYVLGTTRAPDFPLSAGAFDTTLNGRYDPFVAKLSADGSRLLWATLLGGAENENSRELVVDAAGAVFVTGTTDSPDFPTTPGAFDRTCGTDGTCDDNGPRFEDAFVTKIAPDGRSLVWSTFLGGELQDQTFSIALDPSGFPVVAGWTQSAQFPVTGGAIQIGRSGPMDAFVAKLQPDGRGLAWSTYLGGSALDGAGNAVIGPGGAIMVGGGTNSTDFPTSPGAYQTAFAGGPWEAFVAQLTGDGQSIEWATYLGGSGSEGGLVAVSASGAVHVAGFTESTGFPVTADAFDPTYNGGVDDVFLAELSPTGSRLVYSTFLGGSGEDGTDQLVLDPAGNVYLGGRTSSFDFPATAGSFDGTLDGSLDGFVVKSGAASRTNTPPELSWTGEPGFGSDGLDPEAGMVSTTFSYRVAYADADGDPPTSVALRIEKPLGTIWGSFAVALVGWRGAPGDYTAGATFAFTTGLPAGTDFWYSFRADDGWDWATGVPTILVDAPDVYVDDPPLALAWATPTAANLGEPVTFDATGSTDDFGITAYEWDFGDGIRDANPVSAHAYASRGTFLSTLTVWDAANQSDVDTIAIDIQNRPPTADAGPDQNVDKYTVTTLDGTGSGDLDGDPLTHAWVQTAGQPVAVTAADTATPTFTPDAGGTYRFSLTVADGWGGTSSDAVDVVVSNAPPIADAGVDRTVPKNVQVTLDAAGSSDPDGDALSYAWTQTVGPVVVLAGADTATPTFTPPRSSVYGFLLSVSDGDGGVATDSVQVTAANAVPMADAGSDRSAPKVTIVVLDGSRSSDPDGDALSFSWTQVSGPAAVLAGADTATATFAPARVGEYAFRLRVDDGDGGVSDDVVTVVVWGLPPIADLVASPSRAEVGVPITFDASRSLDPDGTIVDFAFAFGDDAVASGDLAVRTHSFAATGNYVVMLTVTDDDGNVSTAQVTIEVTVAAPPLAPMNWKPIMAAVFAAVLAAAGVWASRRRPWRGGAGGMATFKAFAFTSLPFVIAEATTGIVSLLTGLLSIPPVLGPGTLVDSGILVAGLAVALNRARQGGAVRVGSDRGSVKLRPNRRS